MAYQITIVKTEANPAFKEEVAKFFDNRRGLYDSGRIENTPPKEDIVKNVLMVELSDEQYKKVKAEIIKAFE